MIQEFIRIAEEFGDELDTLKRLENSSSEVVEDEYEADYLRQEIADQTKRVLRLRNQLDETAKQLSSELAGDDPLIQKIEKVRLAAWHHAKLFWSEWIECKSSLQAPKAKEKLSRVQPDHEVTVWFRKHHHKYTTRAEAVRQFLTIPSDTMRKSESMYKSLYNRLSKDLDKRPLKAPKTKRKIR